MRPLRLSRGLPYIVHGVRNLASFRRGPSTFKPLQIAITSATNHGIISCAVVHMTLSVWHHSAANTTPIQIPQLQRVPLTDYTTSARLGRSLSATQASTHSSPCKGSLKRAPRSSNA